MSALQAIAMIFLLAGAVLSFGKRASTASAITATVLLVLGYVGYYITADIQVAQDRAAYYGYYQEANWEWFWRHIVWSGDLVRDDVLAELFYILLPDRMPFDFFAGVFMAFSLLALLALLVLSARKGFHAIGALPLMLVALFFDRLFIDAMFNGTRGAVSSMFAMAGLVGGNWAGLLLSWFVAFGIHGKLFVLMSLAILLALLVRLYRPLFLGAVFLALAVFLFRLVYPFPITWLASQYGLVFWASLGPYHPLEGMDRGYALSLSMLVQTGLSILLPACLLSAKNRFSAGGDGGSSGRSALAGLVGDIAIFLSAVILFFFPEFAMAQRLLVIPMVLFLLLLPLRSVRYLAMAKLGLFVLIMAPRLFALIV